MNMTTTFSTPRSCSTRTGGSAAFITSRSWSSSANFLVPAFLKWLSPITGSFAAGNEPVQFELERRAPSQLEVQLNTNRVETVLGVPNRVNTSPLICYEDMFPHLARRAVRDDTDFLVNVTNDGWFGQSAEQWQHMAGAVFRAVENGVPLVRCCNNGVTCWIDATAVSAKPSGTATGVFMASGTLTIDLPLPKHPPTFYNRHGDWFGWGCVGVSLLLIAGRMAKRNAKPGCGISE